MLQPPHVHLCGNDVIYTRRKAACEPLIAWETWVMDEVVGCRLWAEVNLLLYGSSSAQNSVHCLSVPMYAKIQVSAHRNPKLHKAVHFEKRSFSTSTFEQCKKIETSKDIE